MVSMSECPVSTVVNWGPLCRFWSHCHISTEHWGPLCRSWSHCHVPDLVGFKDGELVELTGIRVGDQEFQ